ncbi:transposase [Tautonia sp. JC769]|uniref:transposase n=1 Tax=Tautonia sp. JC769 TaxID=3232135 RepID=UPI003457D232
MDVAILATGRRTVDSLLRSAAPMAAGHVTTSRCVLCSTSWSAMRTACDLCRLVLRLVPDDGPIALVSDDTVESHSGRKVNGKPRHRDTVRSSHGYTAWRNGHKWVVLAVLGRFHSAPLLGPAGARRSFPIRGG